ncbi:MAG: hypothetical protein H0U89_07180 [Acidimicrobiia bacterium]|nr:hypothetical protein [Acidimicrobiia bacterium]
MLKGVIKPWERRAFGTAPETPIGTCMVSSVGAGAASYSDGRTARVPLPVRSA